MSEPAIAKQLVKRPDKRLLQILLIGGALLGIMARPVSGKELERSFLTRHVRDVVLSGQARLIKHLSAQQKLRLDLVLPLRHRARLEKFLRDLYDPSSASFRKFLTVGEFTAEFGPSQEDYYAVIRFANAKRLQVVGGSRDGMDVQVTGTVGNIERAFNVTMGVYEDDATKVEFFAPDREPMAKLPFRLWHVSGLDNYSLPHPLYKRAELSTESSAGTGSGPSGSYYGSDMRAAYYGGNALKGSGQNIALLEYAGFDIDDLNTYYANSGQKILAKVNGISTDGTSLSCLHKNGCDDGEQILDMTQALGMAPGITTLYVYVGSTDTAIFSAMTTQKPLPLQLSCSWGWNPADPITDDPYFEKMEAQGQSFFTAAGDSDEWTRFNAPFPAEDAHVITVGGTDLTTSGAGGFWSSEVGWVDGGGGISPHKIPIPSWQQISGVINASNEGSTIYRNGPDVSANADFSFFVCANQAACTANVFGGTSFAAPMWAGYMALANQQAASDNVPPLGFINPAIYAIGVSSDYETDFHDITSGNNGFPAVAGYDLHVGWGSPNGAALINALEEFGLH
jgi:subtilase family serine protease